MQVGDQIVAIRASPYDAPATPCVLSVLSLFWCHFSACLSSLSLPCATSTTLTPLPCHATVPPCHRDCLPQVGDQIVAMSASWGDRLWEVNSVESFVVGVRTRRDR